MLKGFLAQHIVGDHIVNVVEVNLPDRQVANFLSQIDEHGHYFYRHAPDTTKEIQWFGFCEGRIVAYAHLDRAGNFGCIVHQDFRGCGLGTIMYRAIDTVALRHRISVVMAQVNSDNPAGCRVLRKMDFDFEGPFYFDADDRDGFYRVRKEICGQAS